MSRLAILLAENAIETCIKASYVCFNVDITTNEVNESVGTFILDVLLPGLSFSSRVVGIATGMIS